MNEVVLDGVVWVTLSKSDVGVKSELHVARSDVFGDLNSISWSGNILFVLEVVTILNGESGRRDVARIAPGKNNFFKVGILSINEERRYRWAPEFFRANTINGNKVKPSNHIDCYGLKHTTAGLTERPLDDLSVERSQAKEVVVRWELISLDAPLALFWLLDSTNRQGLAITFKSDWLHTVVIFVETNIETRLFFKIVEDLNRATCEHLVITETFSGIVNNFILIWKKFELFHFVDETNLSDVVGQICLHFVRREWLFSSKVAWNESVGFSSKIVLRRKQG